jgi:hypothetical protein
MIHLVSRKLAFNLISIWSTPPCLYDYMVKVLEKGGAW